MCSCEVLRSSSNMQRKVPETGIKASESLVPSNVNAISSTLSSHGRQCSLDDSESFYKKLKELLESSGFSLVFDVRPQVLDLYLFYLEVTRRGGYYQVSKDGKWDELASALKLEGENNVKLPAQLEKLYANLLYKIEEAYCSKSPTKLVGAQGTSGRSSKKRRNSSKKTSCSMTGSLEQTLLLLPSPNENEMKKRPGPPIGPRNCYQIFLKEECTRLKKTGKLSDGSIARELAIDKWRNISEIERQWYVELSIKDKERYMEEMNAFRLQNAMAGKIRSLNGDGDGDGDYHVSPLPDAESLLVPNNTLMDLALIKAQKASEDSFDWNFYSPHNM